MLLSPVPNTFKGVISNCLTVRPGNTYGTTVTPGNNVYGSYVQCIAATAYETYFMEIVVHGISVAAAAKDALVTIGIDPAGGSAYTDFIQHLVVSNASLASGGPGVVGKTYRFPLRVPAGASIAAKASVNNATVGTAVVAIKLYGRPSHPELVRAGAYVDTFGAVTASSRGTTITSGTTAEGTWTLIGSNVARPYWWWQAGMGINDSTMGGGANGTYTVDVAVGTSTTVLDVVFEDERYCVLNTSEAMGCIPLADHEYVKDVPGDGVTDVFARMRCSGTADSALSVAVYALGG